MKRILVAVLAALGLALAQALVVDFLDQQASR